MTVQPDTAAADYGHYTRLVGPAVAKTDGQLVHVLLSL
jgi:hypothetical protein